MRWTVTSPDHLVDLTVDLSEDGRLTYRIARRGVDVVSASRLGIQLTDHAFDTGLTAVGDETRGVIDEWYELPHGKRRKLHNHANSRVLRFANPSGRRMDLEIRAYSDGAAFRYVLLPESQNGRKETVVSELTTVRPAGPGRAWIQPTQSPTLYGPAYENLYSDGVPIGTESSSHAWDLPATFDVNGAGWLVVTESNLSGSFHGSRLGGSPADGEYSVVGPHEDEGDGVGSALSTSDLPWTTPWRAFAVVDRATDLLAGDLVLNLADPSRLDDTSWVSPGRVSWSWWSENSPRDLARLRAHVDLAADFGWEYSLVDANWTDHTESEMRELVRYASSRGVGTLLWYNSGGPHNHVTLEPRDRMHDATVRRAEFAKIRSWGVAGVKVDFFHSDKQDGIARYLDILEDAAEAKLMVNFHGCTIPRGWSRTWPHLMTMEAVRGAETYIPDHDFERDAPSHNTILPFTRNVAGPMDYTPVTFSDTHRVHLTTMAHELALSVVFESGLLHLADSVESYRAVPAHVANVLKAVPAAWDETRGVSGEPGDHVVVARRLGEQWFVAGISGQSSASTVELDLLRLGGGGRQWRLLRDGDGRDDVLPEDLAPDEAPVRVKMAAHGGFLAHTLD